MSSEAVESAGERADRADTGRARRRAITVLVAATVALVATGATVAWVTGAFDRSGSKSDSTDNGASTSLATVARRTLSTEQQFAATLGYQGSYTVLAQTRGTVTWLPEVGQVIGQGHVLYRVDEAPVVLLYGATPAYRTLGAGATTDMTGTDVAQLNHDLVALGYLDAAEVNSAWNVFNWATKAGIEELQGHLGAEKTGRLDLGDVAFLPTAARVTALRAGLGGPAAGPVMSATSTARTVDMALDAGLQTAVKAGNAVTVTLPDGRTTPGRVSTVGVVATIPSNDSGGAGSSGEPTVPVTIRLTHPRAAGTLDQAPVEVSITNRTVHNAFAVPVTSLLALAGGGYAVEVVDADSTHRLVPVTPGLFDDAAGLVQVSGPGLAAGQSVVVPGDG